MTVREYTPEEKIEMSGGLDRATFDEACARFERAIIKAFNSMPLAIQAAALHGLLCGNPRLQDAVDTLEAACAARNVEG